MLHYDDLKNNERDFLSITSITVFEFQALLMAFTQAFEETSHLTVTGEPRFRKKGGGKRGKLPRMEDKLLFILSYIKNYPLQTYHGRQFGLSQSKTNERIHSLLPKLKRAFEILHCKPSREGTEFVEKLEEEVEKGELVQDGVERMKERPKDKERQKEYYSGKKKTHTEKNLIIGRTDTRWIEYLSPTVEGKKHDKKLADEVGIKYPVGTILQQDTGFQGHAPEGVRVRQPKKKPRGGELTAEEKAANRELSRVRVIIEHLISGAKRIRIVKEEMRLKVENVSDDLMEIACGMHNFRTALRQPFAKILFLQHIYLG